MNQTPARLRDLHAQLLTEDDPKVREDLMAELTLLTDAMRRTARHAPPFETR